ncbi:MAG: hypothetical protein WAN72_19620, partial [Candidatus Acidiferrales bacterium]
GPQQIQEQTARECGQVHTKDDEGFSSEKVILACPESKAGTRSNDDSLASVSAAIRGIAAHR